MRRALLILAIVLTCAAPAQAKVGTDGKIGIEVLSTRADLVSGGDVLLALDLPADADRSAVRVTAGTRDVTSAFATRRGGRFAGVVRNLPVGRTIVTASLDRAAAQIPIDNHDLGGPLFAGPQVQPWICGAGTKGPHCEGPTTFRWWYKSILGDFRPYDREAPPADIATATTDEGNVVPYIVREERGTMDRGFYSVSVLADPVEPINRWRPSAWNHKLHVPFGGDSNNDYSQRPVGSTLVDSSLGRGFMVARNSLNVHGNNSNDTVSAEALLMLKEHIIEGYGDIQWTIGDGFSGGAIQQHMIASMYPGLLDGIIPSGSFPDFWNVGYQIADCKLLAHYFDRTSPQLWPNPVQQNMVRGKGPFPACQGWDATYFHLLDPTAGDGKLNCGVPPEQVYDPATNPKGVRCTIQDYAVAIWGRRPPSVWGPVEKKLGRGFASRPYDNVGVQYGLEQLRSGAITPAQFVDLNVKIGGLDIDAGFGTQRSIADPGTLRTAYRTSQVSDPRQLENVPILDLRPHSGTTIDPHQDYNSYQLRARLDTGNGNHDNQVIWTGALPIVGDLWPDPLSAMDRWIAGIRADRSNRTTAEKVALNRPADVSDACFAVGVRIDDPARCRDLYPYYGEPRIAAGGPMAGDVWKCHLKPLQRSDYNVPFTPNEWASLQAAFPSGVCDWSKQGVGQQPSIPWMTFADGAGGEPLGPSPTSVSVSP